MRVALVQYAQANSAALSLDPARSIGVSGVNAVFRTAPNGGLLIELVAQFVQTARPAETEPDWDDIPVRGGTTIIVGVDGTVRYAIAKPLPHPGLGAANREAQARAAQQQAFTTELRGESPSTPYLKARALRQTYANLRALHGGC
jgi:hypothetical protein